MTKVQPYVYLNVAGKVGYIRCSAELPEAELKARARFIVWLRYAAPKNIPYSLVHVIYTKV